jgi:CRP-like cAMP-binding protein
MITNGALAALAVRPIKPVAVEPILRGVAALDRIGAVQTLRRERTLFEEGARADHYYKVTSGALRMVKTLPDGRRHVGQFFLPGDFAGLTTAETHGFAVEAVTDTTLIRYPRRGVEAMMEHDPMVARQLLSIICTGLSVAQERQLLLGRRTATERVAWFLLAMAARAGGTARANGANGAARADGADGSFVLPMTRLDIADHLGLTIETVSRTLTKLRREGLIDLPKSGRVVIRKRGGLEDLAEQEVTGWAD